jgi:serine/threonine-protein kinase
MKNYYNSTRRDAELELRNESFSVIVIEEFSQIIEEGRVISTTPAPNELLEAGGLAVLRVSAGRKKEMFRVPDLRGLSENDAVARIGASGFRVGNVTYKSSTKKAGTVIAQQTEPKTELEGGSEISFTVSAGQAFSEKTMPSLYGLTVAAAKEKLAEYGLVCGNIYTAQSKEKTGVVIAQSKPAGSALSGTSVIVDLYVSA